MSSASQSTVMTPPGSRQVDDENEHLVPNDEHHHCRISNELLNVDVDLVNSPNPWLPAYGFQIQHQHSYLHSANEDMHKNDPGAITSNDFLETILEETSEDLQSDSERSDGTTYWLGSDSETESVIHIAASQRAPELDECESERNSVIPKKRRRRNRDTGDSFCYCKDSDNNRWASSRSSSRSSTSSRSSSLVQFENLERTCGNVSPSGYSYDSLECSNRSNCYLENTSPDSLEDFEHDNILDRSKRSNGNLNKPNLGVFPKLRPYRSFESLDKCRDNVILEDTSSNRPLARSLWRESFDDQEEYYNGNSDEENHLSHQSLDWRNTVDLREIGLETNREAVLLDLARSQIATSADQLYARLNIDNTNNTALRIASGEQQRGWSNAPSPEFNFRFANKSRSVPSLPSGLEALSSCSSSHDIYNYRTSSATLAGRILSERFENFTRVVSLPVGLNLFATCDDTEQHNAMSQNYHEMADDMAKMAYYHLDGISNSSEDEKIAAMAVESVHSDASTENDGEPIKMNKPTTVKTQDHGLDVVALSNNLDAVVDEAIRQFRSQVEEAASSGQSSELMKQHCSRPRRVKNNASYELAQQWEIDDQNFKLTSSAGDCPRPSVCEKKRIVNNASYELAQQSDYIKALQLTSRPFQRMDACEELLECASNPSPGANDRLEVDSLPVDSHDKKPENLLSQIKKNSVVFSTLGDGGNCTGASMPEDEVDLPCLETKIISSYELLDGQLPAKINNFRANDCRKNINVELIDDLLIDNLNELSSGNKMALETSICADGERLSNITESQQTVEAIEGEIGGDEQLQSTVLLEHCSAKEEVGRNSQSHSTQLASGSSSSSSSVNTPVLSAQSGDGLEDVVAVKEKNTEIVVDQRIIREQHTSLPRVSTMATRSSSLGKADFLGRKSPILSIRSESQDEKKKGGLGGFFQRFSRLRFSGRSKGIDIKKRNVKKPEIVDAEALRKQTEQPTRITEPNYIIIPLHPPEEEKIHNDSICNRDFEASASHMGANGRSPVCSSKPPLPPCQGTRACAPSPRMSTLAEVGARRRAVTDLGDPADIEMAKARVMQHHHRQVDGQYNERPAGLLETDLDADILAVSDEVTGNSDSASKKTRSLLNLNHSSRQGRENVLLRVPQSPGGPGCRSTGDHPDHVSNSGNHHQRPHKSMEFLLDKENLHFIKPPENELQKVMGAAPERVPSEHELRVQRSLQRLNVPDWYKNSPAARDGFRLKRHSDASQHGGWRSLGSKTTSLSSLSSSSNLRQPTTAGPLSSPTPPPVFSRWSTSLLNSTGSSPANSVHSSFNHRQPYLGWRSQERLANPRTPAERLAQGILPQLEAKKQAHQQLDVRNSIKEVTSAIVHYVQSGQEASKNGRLSPTRLNDDHDNDDMCGDNDISMRSIGSRGEGIKLCWMESSFVGSRPVDSPETPMSLATDTECCCAGCNATTGGKSCVNSSASGLYLDLAPSDMSSCPSPSSTCHHRQQRYQRGELLSFA